MSIASQYSHIREEIDAVCRTQGRDPSEVVLLPVSKTVGIAEITEAYDAGARAFGENRPDALCEKALQHPEYGWHFIGNVQSRRIRDIVAHADLIHSLYELKHVLKVNEVAKELGKVQHILLEVNVSGEESKSGLAPCDVACLLQETQECNSICIDGLMTMAPRSNRGEVQRTFSGLRKLRDDLVAQGFTQAPNCTLNELSMGMSEDWRAAIAHGATIVRIGRAIFDTSFVQ